MTRYLVCLGIGMVLGLGLARADEITDRMFAAKELMKAYKNAEALAEFTKLIAIGLPDDLKSEALESAAYCAIRQRHNNPAMALLAMDLAKQIPLKPVSIRCQMVVLLETSHDELIKLFKDEDLAALPEEFSAEAFSMRGRAYASLKKGQEAEADFKSALERRPNDPKYLMALGGNYSTNLKDEQKALATYRLVIEASEPRHRGFDASVAVARIYINNAKYDEALEALEYYKDMSVLADYNRLEALRAFGQANAGLGKEDEAIANFDEANEIQGRK